MTQSPTTYPCPACGAAASLDSGCPGCGRAPDPMAAEVIRLDGEIGALTGRVEQARQAYAALAATLRDAQQRRNELAARVRAAAFVGRPAGSAAASAGSAAASAWPPPATPASPARPEASTRTVQNLLFVLGGLLLCTAAIVFTVVAWAAVGVAGRAAILAALTALALAVPPLAVRRGLTATAETFAVVGLLLVVLDGYAAWTVDLFGVAGWPSARYAALVGVVSAAVAAGYGRVTRLAAPWFAALLVAQPVLPLLAYDANPDAAGWALLFAAVAALDLAVVWRLRGGGSALAGRIVGWVAYGCALAGSGMCGLVALVVSDVVGPVVLAGGPLLVAVLLLVAGSVLARDTVFRALAGGVLVVAVAAAAIRPAAELWWSLLLVAGAVIVAALAAAVAATARLLPAGVRVGPRIGGLFLTGVLALPVGAMALGVAVGTVARSLPAWRGDVTSEIPFDWQLPVAVGLVIAALVLLLPRTAREGAAVAGGVVGVLALPAAAARPWWAVPALDLAAGLALLLAAVHPLSTRRWRRRSDPATAPSSPGPVARILRAGAGALLVGHAVLVGLARPAAATAVLAVVLLVGIAVGAVAIRRSSSTVERAIGGTALGTGLLAAPAMVTVGLFALGVAPWWQDRAGAATAALLVASLVAVRRRCPAYLPYAGTALAVAALVTGLSPIVAQADEPLAVYASVGVLLVAAGLSLVGPARSAALLASGAGLLVAAAAVLLPAVGAVLVAPYAWLEAIWSGVPAGAGLIPAGTPPVAPLSGALDVPAGVGLVVLAAAAALTGWAYRRAAPVACLAALPFGATALLVILAAAGARWPTVPAVALVGGLGCLLAAALGGWRTRAAPILVPLGVVLAGPGLAGLLPAEASTLAGLGLILAVAAAAGAAGRTLAARTAGWLAAAVAGVTLAVAASRAADLPLHLAAFPVLGVAALALAVGAALRSRRPARASAEGASAARASAARASAARAAAVEARAVEAASFAGAVVALLLAAGELRYAAAVGTLWGAAVGVRALRPGEPAGRRWVFTAVAAGSELLAVWLLLAAQQVALLEAYTLPAAALGLVAGWLAIRAWPALSSWVAYGPGLAAALLPSLASVLVAGGQPWRRLLLGVGALIVVLAGAGWRRQAPVLLGGAVLAVVALYEVVGAWDRLPRWIFLAAGGFVLIGLATTYERRRRDMTRLRAAVSRMT